MTLLEDYKPEPRPLRWASLSPDDKTVVFARNHNLFMMDAENYAKALKKAERPDDRRGPADDRRRGALQLREPQRRARQPGRPAATAAATATGGRAAAGAARGRRRDRTRACRPWPSVVARLEQVLARPARRAQGRGPLGHQRAGQSAPDARDLSLRDARRGEHAAVGDPRLRPARRKSRVKVKADGSRTRRVSIATKPQRPSPAPGVAAAVVRADRRRRRGPEWLHDAPDKLYFTRLSRDLHRLDVCVADTATGEVKTLIEERLNTYIETQAAAPRRQRHGADLLVRARRLGALLPL